MAASVAGRGWVWYRGLNWTLRLLLVFLTTSSVESLRPQRWLVDAACGTPVTNWTVRLLLVFLLTLGSSHTWAPCSSNLVLLSAQQLAVATRQFQTDTVD